MAKSLGIALGAGGSRGVAHIGFLQALDEVGIKADFVTGCSMGSIVGACYCAGVPVEKMREIALSLKLSQIASVNRTLLKEKAPFRLDKAREMMEGLFGDIDFEELKIPFRCVATNLSDGRIVELKKGNVIDAVVASSTIPGVFPPASAGGHQNLIDGGILERVPTKELKKMGAEVIIAVDVLGDLSVKKTSGSLIATMLRCIDIMDTHNTHHKKHSRNIDLWIEPELGGMDQYKLKDIHFAYEKGYESGVVYREQIKSLVEG